MQKKLSKDAIQSLRQKRPAGMNATNVHKWQINRDDHFTPATILKTVSPTVSTETLLDVQSSGQAIVIKVTCLLDKV